MYIDKDSQGKYSIIDISKMEIGELGAILREFECLIYKSEFTTESAKAAMILNSSKLRFLIIDALK